MIWLYLVDSCSIAGLWKKDFRGLNFNCNTKITEVEFLATFGSRIIDRGNYYFIPKFLRYQCPKGLNSNKPAIVSIVKELEQNNLIEIVRESLGNDFLIIKGTGKGKDKGKGTGTGKEPEQLQFSDTWFNEIFDALTMEQVKMVFPNHDLDNELKIFRLKVRGSPKDYLHRDAGGMRTAFTYQLSKSNGNRVTTKGTAQPTTTIIEPGKDFGISKGFSRSGSNGGGNGGSPKTGT